MTRLYRLLSQANGSLAVALLAVALATGATRVAFADVPPDPCPCLEGETPEECAERCATGVTDCSRAFCISTNGGCTSNCDGKECDANDNTKKCKKSATDACECL